MPRLLPARFAAECIREFDRAADERYADAERLADAGRRTGAIYLYGYVVEMVLKAAFLRLADYADDDEVSTAALWRMVGARPNSIARSLGLTGTDNLHDLAAWAELIVAFRAHRGRVYTNPTFARTLTHQVGVVHRRWSEVVRYHKNRAYQHELDRVRVATRWVVDGRSRI